MALLIQRMYPTAHFCSFTQGQGYGLHLAAGNWAYYASQDCAAKCADPYGALDERDYGAARSEGVTGQINYGRFEWTFGDPPQNVTISNLTLVAYFRTSSGNTAAIDTPPTVEFFVDPASGTRDYYGAAETVDHPTNRNTQAATGTFYRYSRSWASKPGGGAWTQSELIAGSFKAGIESDGSSHGSGIYKTTGGNTASFDVAAFWVELETSPAGIYVEPVRTVLSQQLRLLSKPTRTFTIDVPPEFGDVNPGDIIWSSHEMLPGDPGHREWEQVPLYVTGVADALDPPRLSLTCLDLRSVYADYYSPLQILGVDEQNSGLARYDQGGGWETTRSQVVYAPRPGDELYQEIIADLPYLTDNGLLCQGSSDTNYLLNSTFSVGSSNSFTSWTSVSTGSGTVQQDTEDYLIDTAGMQRSVKLTVTTSSDRAYLHQTSSSFAANTELFVRAWYKNDSGSDPLQFWIRRSSDNYFWDDSSSGGWDASAVPIEPALSTTIARYTSRQIDIGTSAATIQVLGGYYGGATFPFTGANVAHLYSIELQSGGTFSWCRRELLPTTTGTITRATNTTLLSNAESFRILPMNRGSFELDFVPLWSHSDLASLETKAILQHAFNGAASPAGYVLGYSRTDSTSGSTIGTWAWHGATFVATTSDGNLPVAGTPIQIEGRYTYGDENQYGGTNQEFDIWIDGVKGTSFGPVVATAGAPSACVSLGVAWLGDDPITAYYADGYIKNLVINGWRPEDAAVAVTRPAMPPPNSSLLEDLLAAYHLDETTGTRVDSFANYDLTENGTVGYAAGKNGNAASFTDDTTYLEDATTTLYPGQTGRGATFACWIRRSAGPSSLAACMSSPAAANPSWQLRVNASNGRPNVFVRDLDGNVLSINATSGPICDDTWHLMIVTFNEGGDRKVHLYVPTVGLTLESSTGTSDYLLNTGPGIHIGIGHGTTYPWGGSGHTALVDHALVWDRALNATERAALETQFYPFGG